MKFQGNTLVFEKCDMSFVERFGITSAVEMVNAFRSFHNLPFIFDTYQLAAFLGVPRKTLFTLVRKRDSHYTSVMIRKKSGGVRHLKVPRYLLAETQRKILDHILSLLPVSPYATAYHCGATLMDNALPHCGKRYLLKMDICDFFSSIRFEQVYVAAFHSGYFPKQIGVMLTSLCCYRDELPQGAPSSPALSNVVMKHFDDTMGRWCEKRGISFTRYCDDITFSADKPLYPAYIKAKSLLSAMGFQLNEKKTVFLTSASRQVVTGLTVNEKPNVSKDYRRTLRQEIYYVLKFGVEDAIRKANRTAFIDNGEPLRFRYLNHLEGRVRFVLQVRPDDNGFRKMLDGIREMRRQLEEEFDVDCLPF